MLKFDKIMNNFWAPMMKKYKDDETINSLKERLPQLEQFVIDNLNGNEFLGGTDQPMYIDIHCIGYAERLLFLEGSCWNDGYEKLAVNETLKVTRAWVERMQAHPLLKQHLSRRDFFHAHSEGQEAAEPGVKYQLSITYLDQTEKR